MGLCVGLVKLIQDGIVVAVTGIEGVCFDICLQPLGKGLSMAAPPRSLELHQKLVDSIRVSALFDQLVAKAEQLMERKPIFLAR